MHCMLAKHYINGAFYPVGGGMAFSRLIAPIIERAGGAVLHSAEVSEIVVEAGVPQGVRLSSGEEIRCPVVISNAAVQNTFSRMLSPHVSVSLALSSYWKKSPIPMPSSASTSVSTVRPKSWASRRRISGRIPTVTSRPT